MKLFSGESISTALSISIFGVDQTAIPDKGSYWGIDLGTGFGYSVVKNETQAWAF